MKLHKIYIFQYNVKFPRETEIKDRALVVH